MSEVQEPIAPITTEINEFNPPTDEMPEQESDVVPKVNIPFMISLLSLIFTEQSAGIRIIVDLPSQTDNFTPLFTIRANPLVLSPEVIRWLFRKSNPGGLGYLSSQLMPVMRTYTTSPGVTVIYWGAPPLIGILAAMYRKWRGGLEFSLQCTSSFANQGFVTMSPRYNCFQGLGPSNMQRTDASALAPDIHGQTSYRQGMFNSFVKSDASSFRHMSVKMPFRYPTPWFDTFQFIDDRITSTFGTDTASFPEGTNITPCNQNFIDVSNLNTINATNPSGNNQIIYELFVKASPDFEFADRHQFHQFWDVPCETPTNNNIVVIPNPDANTSAVGNSPGLWFPFLTGLPKTTLTRRLNKLNLASFEKPI